MIEALTLWQLADSAFPTGGFAHSGGLEAAHAYHPLRGANDVGTFIQDALPHALRGSAPFVCETYAHPECLPAIDVLCDAFLSNHVANRASRAQGRALLNSAARIFSSPPLAHCRKAQESLSAPSHLAPIFGVIAHALQLTLDQTLNLQVFLTIRSWISAAIRLNILGPLEGQTLQHDLAAPAHAYVDQLKDFALHDVAGTAPLLDLFHASHDRLYMRLFQT